MTDVCNCGNQIGATVMLMCLIRKKFIVDKKLESEYQKYITEGPGGNWRKHFRGF